jgi:hypothetical protein
MERKSKQRTVRLVTWWRVTGCATLPETERQGEGKRAKAATWYDSEGISGEGMGVSRIGLISRRQTDKLQNEHFWPRDVPASNFPAEDTPSTVGRCYERGPHLRLRLEETTSCDVAHVVHVMSACLNTAFLRHRYRVDMLSAR